MRSALGLCVLRWCPSQDLGDGLVLDLGEDQSVVGLEITNPTMTSAHQVCQVLAEHGLTIDVADVTPWLPDHPGTAGLQTDQKNAPSIGTKAWEGRSPDRPQTIPLR